MRIRDKGYLSHKDHQDKDGFCLNDDDDDDDDDDVKVKVRPLWNQEGQWGNSFFQKLLLKVSIFVINYSPHFCPL